MTWNNARDIFLSKLLMLAVLSVVAIPLAFCWMGVGVIGSVAWLERKLFDSNAKHRGPDADKHLRTD